MKKAFSLLFILLVLVRSGSAQTQTKYCRIELVHVSPGKAVTINIETGSDRELSKQIKSEDSSFVGRTFAYVIDVVNYMANRGWELVTAQTYGRQGDDYLFFKKAFKQ